MLKLIVLLMLSEMTMSSLHPIWLLLFIFIYLMIYLGDCIFVNNFCLTRYATASARSDGLLLLCGGRDANSVVS